MVSVGRQKAQPIEDSDVPAVLDEAMQLEEADQKQEAAAKLEELLKRLSNKQKPQKIDVYGRLTGLYEAIYQQIQDAEQQTEQENLDDAGQQAQLASRLAAVKKRAMYADKLIRLANEECGEEKAQELIEVGQEIFLMADLDMKKYGMD